MYKKFFFVKFLWLSAISYWLLACISCSPKVQLGIWAKKHSDAATALGTWAANNPAEATALLNLDCSDPKQFKKKINDALNGSTQVQQPAQQNGYDVRQHNYHYGNSQSRNSNDGFGDWCRKYPAAAKKLRGHAKALCKAGLGILSGAYKIN